VAEIAVDARTRLKLRHVPLWVANGLAYKHHAGHPPARLVEDTIAEVVRRPDELGEFLKMYWRLNRRATVHGAHTPHKRLSAQVKKGLARALGICSEYRLAKWDRDVDVRLRDVLFLTHAKPRNEAQAALWKRLVARQLTTPDTWDAALSTGQAPRRRGSSCWRNESWATWPCSGTSTTCSRPGLSCAAGAWRVS
jgi:60 kDa SS-A/Ro ribonucleoprotein